MATEMILWYLCVWGFVIDVLIVWAGIQYRKDKK